MATYVSGGFLLVRVVFHVSQKARKPNGTRETFLHLKVGRDIKSRERCGRKSRDRTGLAKGLRPRAL